ncbi:hypothetical protein BJX62DRAFT_9122 [Aspergillus germanicus]
MTVFLATLVHQCLSSVPVEQSLAMAKFFLGRLRQGLIDWVNSQPETVSLRPRIILQQALDLPAEDIRGALADLLIVAPRGFSLIVDGLDKAAHRQDEFVQGIRDFIGRVSNGLVYGGLKFYVLLTSRPAGNIKTMLGDVVCLEYDKERKGVRHPLPMNQTNPPRRLFR